MQKLCSLREKFDAHQISNWNTQGKVLGKIFSENILFVKIFRFWAKVIDRVVKEVPFYCFAKTTRQKVFLWKKVKSISLSFSTKIFSRPISIPFDVSREMFWHENKTEETFQLHKFPLSEEKLFRRWDNVFRKSCQKRLQRLGGTFWEKRKKFERFCTNFFPGFGRKFLFGFWVKKVSAWLSKKQ